MNLFVNNISALVNEDDLKTLFSKFSKVDKVELIMSKDTGKSEMFAFIEMADTNGASSAIKALDGRLYFGKYLEVKEIRNNPHGK
jgi:RNA recognition motif-containing protein